MEVSLLDLLDFPVILFTAGVGSRHAVSRVVVRSIMSIPNGINVSRELQLQDELRSTKDELSRVMQTLKNLHVRKKELEEKIDTVKTELKLLNESHSSSTKFEVDSFSWSKDLNKTLKSVFNIEEFRSYQKAAINATMSNLDVILIMPTGKFSFKLS